VVGDEQPRVPPSLGRRRPSACRVRLATRKLGEVVRLVTSIPRARFAPSAPLPMPPSPWAADARTRFVKLGGSAINARYAALVERLYPGCSWRVPPNRLDPVRAVVAGKVVALVMPLNVWPRRPVKAVRA